MTTALHDGTDKLEQAAFNYQDARTGPATDTREHLLALADSLADQALVAVEDHRNTIEDLATLQKRYDDNYEELEQANRDIHQLNQEQDEPGEFDLALLVRDEHDIAHVDPWSVCGFAMCRLASQRVSR